MVIGDQPHQLEQRTAEVRHLRMVYKLGEDGERRDLVHGRAVRAKRVVEYE